MGLILIPDEVNTLTKALENALTSINEGFKNVSSEVSCFADNDKLQGDSWKKLKEKASEYHGYIEKGMEAVRGCINDEISSLNQSVGSEPLDEDMLRDVIERMQAEIVRVQNMIDMLEAQRSSSVFSPAWNARINQRIAVLEQQLEHAEYILKIYQEKLEFLYSVEDSTKGLFNTGIQLISAMAAVISEVGVKIMTGNPDATLQGIDCKKWINIIDDNARNNSHSEEISGLSDKGFKFLMDYELGTNWISADYIKIDEKGSIIEIRNHDVGDGGITVGVGIYVKESDVERIEMLKELGIIWNDINQWVEYDTVIKAYNNISGTYMKTVDDAIERYNVEISQEQYDALFVLAYNRKAFFYSGGAIDKLLSVGSSNKDEWRATLLDEYRSLDTWDTYGEGWTNRVEDALELYFEGDYIRDYG